MNANVFASYALISRLKSQGVTHCVISPGSRSTPLAYVANELLVSTVVIDERDAGFVALGLSESTKAPSIVITTSGSAPTHLYPSVVEAFHSNVPLIVITSDRPHEIRGIGAPQTIDQINMFGTSVRFFADAICPTEQDSIDYWHEMADELYAACIGDSGVPGPVQLNMGMREPLVPDGTELEAYTKQSGNKTDTSKTSGGFGFSSSSVSSEKVLNTRAQELMNGAQKGLIAIGRNSGLNKSDVENLTKVLPWPVLADVTSNIRFMPDLIISYDAIMRIEGSKSFIPEVVLQLGDPLTSKLFNETISSSEVISVRQFADSRDPYRNASISITTRNTEQLIKEIKDLNIQSGNDFQKIWLNIQETVLETSRTAILRDMESEPTLFYGIGEMLSQIDTKISCLIGSSMPIRYAEWFWHNPSEKISFFSHRGTNGIDGMLSSAAGICLGSKLPTLCVLGDVAFTHDIGFLTQCSKATNANGSCLVFLVVDNAGGAIFRHLDQAKNDTLADSYTELLQTEPGIDVQAIAKASNVNYVSGSKSQCIQEAKSLLQQSVVGTHVIHVEVGHESGPDFMKKFDKALSELNN